MHVCTATRGGGVGGLEEPSPLVLFHRLGNAKILS